MWSGRCGRGWRFWRRSRELNEADPELELQVRVGINTGEAVVALGARPEQGEGIVTGDVVNTAARIQGAAPVGGVAVGEQTFRATERVFEYEPLEPVVGEGEGGAAVAVAGEGGSCPLRNRHHPPVHDAAGRPRAGEAAVDRDVRAGGAAALGAARHDHRRAGGGQEQAGRRAVRLSGDKAGADPLATGALPAVRGGDHVLGVGRDRQGGGGDPRVRLRGGGGGETGRGGLP